MGDVDLVQHPEFARRLAVTHGFTGRRGGPDGALLQLAARSDLPGELLVAGWQRVLGAMGMDADDARLALVTQVHGDRVVVVERGCGALGSCGEADALVTTTPGLAVAVRVADCVPVLLAAPGGVAAVHAGWRGVAQGILPKTLEVLATTVGCELSAIEVLIGPHISADAYEVGPEVVQGIEASGVPREAFARPGRADRFQVSLDAALRVQVARLGPLTVRSTGGCTRTERYFSFRHDGPDTGRQAGVIAWRG